VPGRHRAAWRQTEETGRARSGMESFTRPRRTGGRRWRRSHYRHGHLRAAPARWPRPTAEAAI